MLTLLVLSRPPVSPSNRHSTKLPTTFRGHLTNPLLFHSTFPIHSLLSLAFPRYILSSIDHGPYSIANNSLDVSLYVRPNSNPSFRPAFYVRHRAAYFALAPPHTLDRNLRMPAPDRSGRLCFAFILVLVPILTLHNSRL